MDAPGRTGGITEAAELSSGAADVALRLGTPLNSLWAAMTLRIDLRLISQAGQALPSPDIEVSAGFLQAWRVAVCAAQQQTEELRLPVCAKLMDDRGKLLALRYFFPPAWPVRSIKPQPADGARAPA